MDRHSSDGPRRQPAAGPNRRGTGQAGTRFRTSTGSGPAPAARRAPAAHHAAGPHRTTPRPAPVRPVRPRAARKRTSPAAVAAGVIAAVAVAVVLAVLVVPRVGALVGGAFAPAVEAGQEVRVTVAQGASGDEIAQTLSENHVIDRPQDYYAAVEQLGAAQSIKPGDYLLYTGMDPVDVVNQLVEGPNAGNQLTVQEGLTVAQTAARVEEALGIPADEFLAQAKASNYAADYPFVEGAYDDSLEGYLYPKTYTFTEGATADDVIRAMLDQFEVETEGLDLASGANGLTAQQIVSMASLIERETAVEQERPVVASVIYNRLDDGMYLQIDAAIVYARGGGSDPVTYSDLEIDSPYNVYTNLGLTPGPICSPSVSSIEAALNPDETDYLYYVASPEGDGTHRFSSDYAQFERDSQAYAESLS